MRTLLDPVRAEIRALTAYALPPTPGAIRAKLDFNESPFDVPADIKEAVLSRVKAMLWSRYPETGAGRLKSAIASAIGRSPDEIVVGNGSGEVILAAVSVLAGGGGALLLAPPTFSLYRQMAAIAGARVVDVARTGADLDVEAASLLRAASDPRAVPLVCSPNNPTGGTVSRELVRDLCATAGAVLLDQAYADFAEPEDDALPLLAELPNLVIFRTLSKAFSVAGFRIGYAVAAPELAREIEKAVLPYSVDLAAEELAIEVLENGERARLSVRAVVEERERVEKELVSMGLRPARSRANFLFFRPGERSGPGVRAALLERGILVRDLHRVHADHLRVSIGTREENDLFLSALGEVLEEPS